MRSISFGVFDMIPRIEEIAAAIETLQQAGVEGTEHLCLSTTTILPQNESASWYDLVPPCSDPDLQSNKLEDDELVARNVIGAVITVFCIAVAAGLFLGLMTLDVLDLQIIVRSSVDEDEVKYAKTLLPIVRDRHRLLVTLLLMDTLAYETLPIFLDQLMAGWIAVLLSTSLIVVVGEIVPSGIFTGPNQLYLGYRLSPVVKFFMALLYPVAKPLGKLLDWLVDEDEEDQWYDRGELSALVRIQHEERTKRMATTKPGQRRLTKVIKYVRHNDRHWNDLKAEIMESVKERAETADHVDDEEAAVEQMTPPLHPREVDMVEGALSMKTKLAMDVYTPFKHVYAVPDDLVLDKATITIIYSHGFSRVPVYRSKPGDPDNNTAVIGYLITRQLMMVDWNDLRELRTLPLQRPTCVSPRINLVDLLKLLQTKGPLMTFVCARPDLANRAMKAHLPIPVEAGLIGIITLVDIMESVLQDRIYDESDIRDRNQAVATLHRWAATKLQSFVRRRSVRRRSKSPPSKRMHIVQTRSDDMTTEQTPLLGTNNGGSNRHPRGSDTV